MNSKTITVTKSLEMNAVYSYYKNTTKEIACQIYGIEYYDFYARIYTYSYAPPKQFMTILMKEYGSPCMQDSRELIEKMYKSIPLHITLKQRCMCICYIIEYIACIVQLEIQILELFPGTKDELYDSLPVYSDTFFASINSELQFIHASDVILFNQLTYRISTFHMNKKTECHYTRALEYMRKLIKCNQSQRTYVNDGSLDMSFLESFQMVYERILYAKHHIDNLGARDSIFHAVVSQKPFLHSSFGEKCANSRCFDIPGRTNTLHIHTPTHRPFNLGDIRGALQILSYGSESVFCDRRLNHHLFPSKLELDAKFNDPSKPTLTTPNLNFKEYVFFCLNKIFTKETVFPSKLQTSKAETECLRKKSLELAQFQNYENNMQLSITYVQDYLLWILCRRK